MTGLTVLTPAQWDDLLHDARCQYVARGRHSLALHEVTGQVTCDNPGCPLDAIHPGYGFTYRRATARTPAARAVVPPVRTLRFPWSALVVAGVVLGLVLVVVLP